MPLIEALVKMHFLIRCLAKGARGRRRLETSAGRALGTAHCHNRPTYRRCFLARGISTAAWRAVAVAPPAPA